MADPRWQILADLLLNHSVKLAKGETLLVECFDLDDLTLPGLLVRGAAQRGARAYVELRDNRVIRDLTLHGDDEFFRLWGRWDRHRMEDVQAYLGLRGARNIGEMSDVPSGRMSAYSTHYLKPVHLESRIKSTKWCVLRMPGPGMAQQAGMSTEAFERFYFDVCCLDYARMARALEPLARRMRDADEARVLGPGTDLRFSIKGMPVVSCAGEKNIPDGEVFTAPHVESVEGVIQFNTPTVYQGAFFEGIRLVFKRGRIVEADCRVGDSHRLRAILHSDEGACRIGEFAIGCNPRILQPMRDILFDEKIAGSLHLAPGNAYDEADNGNRSKVHWDLVLIQRPECGGGRIEFDGQPIRVDGRFLAPELQPLDPE
ncbi:peptidase M29 aminopeptidase II [Isosphaera pallida ATCC 43644]|jgi:aminopeptidase|uniref:Peptidase M29 aminopeptidase II n=1 Tax=Isosphaera pallida (strain ATCC 43644 / DSM 9630 / IS1B) TaxID=575540 RepID=E8R3J8_ISOPI|nr:aminopeptidase [Isosphaera pallida]ADV61565.1 peptidase M29 aminopeptidase II [Isosphaera pallida ATCC 43644]